MTKEEFVEEYLGLCEKAGFIIISSFPMWVEHKETIEEKSKLLTFAEYIEYSRKELLKQNSS